MKESNCPQSVRDLYDWGDFVLKSVFDTFAASVSSLMLGLQNALAAQQARLDGLGDSATRDVGVEEGTVAAGDHTHSEISNGPGGVEVTPDGHVLFGFESTESGVYGIKQYDAPFSDSRGSYKDKIFDFGFNMDKSDATVPTFGIQMESKYRYPHPTQPYMSEFIHFWQSADSSITVRPWQWTVDYPTGFTRHSITGVVYINQGTYPGIQISNGTFLVQNSFGFLGTTTAGAVALMMVLDRGDNFIVGSTLTNVSIFDSGSQTWLRAGGKIGIAVDNAADSVTQTTMSVRHNGTLKRVFVGPPDSAGEGYRSLRIAN